MESFQIIQSHKAGLNSKESYLVARGDIGFLRILGEEPHWTVMTATASEDNGSIKVCNDQLRLVESALLLGNEYKTEPSVEVDRLGREYVKICVIKQESNKNDEPFMREVNSFISRFFEYYDNNRNIKTRNVSEMRDLYTAIAIDDDSGDVYLSDGVWLSSDGKLHDRGR